MFLKHLFLILLAFISYNQPKDQPNRCNPDKYMWISEDIDVEWNVTVFSNFNKISDLSKDCNQAYNTTKWIQFLPKNGLVIDQSFNISNLATRDRTYFIEYLIFNKIIGIDIYRPPSLEKNVSDFVITALAFYYSKLVAYSNGIAIGDHECNLQVYNNTDNFFQSFFIIYFRNVVYSEICPLIFRNSYVFSIFFGDISNSYLIKNRFKFTKLNLSIEFDFHKNPKAFTNVIFDINYDFFTGTMLDKYLFKNLGKIKITGFLLGVDIDLFGDFKKLKEIFFEIDDYRFFFHRSTTWFENLNSRIKVDLTDRVQVKRNLLFNNEMYLTFEYPSKVSFDRIYEYPNEDICIFKNFPHKHMVYPLFRPGKLIDCSCTLMWLQYYNYIYEPTDETSFKENINLMNKVLYEEFEYEYCNLLVKCDFEKMFNNCKIMTRLYDVRDAFIFNDVSVLFTIKWLQLILLTLLQPFLALIGIINNFLIILVIKNQNKKKLFKESMYQHILINSSFNIFYCIILLLRLVNTCLFYESEVFCSSLYQLDSSQYFKIIFIFYVGNIAKICSNISYLSFSFSRFTVVSMNKENKFYIKFKTMNLKLYCFFLIILSSIVSTFLLFQYKLNSENDPTKEFPYEKRNEKFCSYKINFLECEFFNAFKIINSILTSVIVVILNSIIDLCLLRDYGIDIKKKLKMATNKNKIEELKKKKKEVTKMVFVNGLIFFFSRIPQFLTSIMLLFFANRISEFCHYKLSCDLINEEAEFFNLISIVVSFFIFKKFDHNFKDSWADLLHRFFILKK